MSKRNLSVSSGRVVVQASLLVALLTVAASAVAQSGATADRAVSAASVRNATTTPAAKQHDPYGPFVYDALGATPSVRLPWQRKSVSPNQAETESARSIKEVRATAASVRSERATR